MSVDRDAVAIQRRYYTDTATCYEAMHSHEGSGDAATSRIVHSLLRMSDVGSILDVGTATARGVRELKQAFPNAFVCGIEPVSALLQQAVQAGNAAFGSLVLGSGDALPFPDASFDAVCEFAILHHVSKPAAVVREMLRVAKKAVILCDSNRFGQGSFPARLFKLLLFKLKLWGAFNYVRTGGKGYQITEGDGLAYSYSVYDSFHLLAEWADRLILIPNDGQKSRSWFHPLLTSAGVIVCALRERNILSVNHLPISALETEPLSLSPPA